MKADRADITAASVFADLEMSISWVWMIAIIILKLIMKVNKEENEQCFINEEFEEVSHPQPMEIKVEIFKKINEQMPANELRIVHRPQNLAPRTFYLDRPLYLLRDCLNAPCEEEIREVKNNRQKQVICNSNNLSIEEYFSRKKFECIFNKLQTYRGDNRVFTGKMKGVDQLIDYNERSFKELEMEVDLLGEQREERIDSDFESGNLCRGYSSIISGEKEYFLLVENDLNTYGYNNWFFFRFRNQEKGIRRFHIVNLIKKTSFYNQGMLISIFSQKDFSLLRRGWFKGGDNITFSPVNLLRQRHHQCYYCLSFEYTFENDNDEVYFAPYQPYTYTRLVNFLEASIQKQTRKESPLLSKIQMKPLSYSIANNIIPVVKISQRNHSNTDVIVILARQHPCQTVGSFIAEKIMKLLANPDEICKYLLSHVDFIVIPMVNPDGVIHGMSRANMAGLDLNRQWGDNILKELTPETIKIQQYIFNLSKSRKIKYLIDLHGHGKKLNSFFFCCRKSDRENNQLLSLCMKELENRFSLCSCTFGITKDKESTIRSQMFAYGVKNSYTLETSLYGWKDEENRVRHFNERDYEEIGRSLLRSIFLAESEESQAMKYLGVSKEAISSQMPLIREIEEKEEKMTFEYSEMMSDSDPEGDKLDVKDLLGKCENKLFKKKLQDSYRALNIQLRREGKKKPQTSKETKRITTLRESDHLPNQTSFIAIPNNSRDSFTRKDHRKVAKNIAAMKMQEAEKEIFEKVFVEKKEELIESLNITKNKNRKRIKTEVSRPQKQPIEKRSANYVPNLTKYEETLYPLKYQKVQFKSYIKTQPDQPVTIERKTSNHFIRTAQNRKPPSSILPTEIISIFKFSKQRKPFNPPHFVKNVTLQPSKKTAKLSTTRHTSQQGTIDKTSAGDNMAFLRVRNFQNLLQGKGSSHSQQLSRQISTVYYRFPVL